MRETETMVDQVPGGYVKDQDQQQDEGLNVSDNSIYYLIIPTGLVEEVKKSCYKNIYIENKYSFYTGSIYSFQIVSVTHLYQKCSVFSFEMPIQKSLCDLKQYFK